MFDLDFCKNKYTLITVLLIMDHNISMEIKKIKSVLSFNIYILGNLIEKIQNKVYLINIKIKPIQIINYHQHILLKTIHLNVH